MSDEGKYWSISDILNESKRVHYAEVEWHGKILRVPYRVPTDSEKDTPLTKAIQTPKDLVPGSMEQAEHMGKIAETLTRDMLNLASDAEGAITPEAWAGFGLPLKSKIVSKVFEAESEAQQDFFERSESPQKP